MNETSASPLALLLPQAMIIEISGGDAVKVMNNLTTNDVAKSLSGAYLESFVTDLRGWTVAHGIVLREDERIVLVGQHPDPGQVSQHIDRYIIREDAKVADLSQSHSLFFCNEAATADGTPVAPLKHNPAVRVIPAPITACGDQLLLGAADLIAPVATLETNAAAEQEFERRRILNFWPRMGQDILAKCIPQELDRDARAISFTKGCYLGQETIARLDARGQLQRKLCLLQIEAAGIHAGDRLTRDGKEVGQITSAAASASQEVTHALAFLKRGNFEVGSRLTCQGALAEVLAPGQA